MRAPDPNSVVWRSIVQPTKRRALTETILWFAVAGNVTAALLHIAILVFA